MSESPAPPRPEREPRLPRDVGSEAADIPAVERPAEPTAEPEAEPAEEPALEGTAP